MVSSLQEFFDGLEGQLDESKSAGMNDTFQFVATGEGGGDWYVRFTDGKGEVSAGAAEDPTIVLTASAEDWIAIMNGDMNGQTAFLTEKLKIDGDMTLAMKLESLFNLG